MSMDCRVPNLRILPILQDGNITFIELKAWALARDKFRGKTRGTMSAEEVGVEAMKVYDGMDKYDAENENDDGDGLVTMAEWRAYYQQVYLPNGKIM